MTAIAGPQCAGRTKGAGHARGSSEPVREATQAAPFGQVSVDLASQSLEAATGPLPLGELCCGWHRAHHTLQFDGSSLAARCRRKKPARIGAVLREVGGAHYV